MAAPRKLPPEGAAEDIRRLAAEGFGQVGIAAHFNVSRDCFKRWIEESEELNDAYEMGKETERQALHAMVVASAKANKGANVNAFFLLKTRHGYVETDNRTAKVNVDVAVSSVLVVKDHGDDAEWAARCAAQQRALIEADSASPRTIETSTAPLVEPLALPEPPAICEPAYAPTVEPVPVPAPVAPSWAAPANQTAPVTAAPHYGPPVFAWEPQAVPVPAEPKLTFGTLSMPPSPVEAPVWRGRA
jgi:hypothetical protein